MIRAATPQELPRLAEIEEAAEQGFRGTPMAFVLDLPRGPVATALPPHVLVWVSVDEADMAVGFLEAEPIGDWLHIWELSVHPQAQRQGRARALVEAACGHARAAGLARVSLTTDREIAFNAPMYRRMGFAELEPSAHPDWLAALLAREAAHGFDPARRIAMARQP
jgi:ribosomal protein S18 acetylase RimI-like enzyme